MPGERTCIGCGTGLPTIEPSGEPGSFEHKLSLAAAGACRYCDSCIDAQEARFAQDQDRLARQRRMAMSNIPRRLRSVTFDRLDNTGIERPLADAKAWAEGDLSGLILAGDVGVGKTWLAAAAANARLERGRLRWISTPALLAKAVAAEDEAKAEALDILTGDYGAIVLDDFDKTNVSDWAVAQLFLAVDNAVEQGRSLLVTTNMGPGEIASRYGEPVASRLVGYCNAHRLTGQDRRVAA